MAWASRSGSAQRALMFVVALSVAGWSPASRLRAQAPGTLDVEAPVPDGLDEPEVTPPPPAGGGERAVLEKRLQEVEREREERSNLWPWLTVVLGATGVVVGTATGVANAFDCEVDEPGCNSQPWAAFAVVLGFAIGTLGTIWLVRTNRGIAELELKKDQIKYDLQRLEAARQRSSGLAHSGGSQLRFTLQF